MTDDYLMLAVALTEPNGSSNVRYALYTTEYVGIPQRFTTVVHALLHVSRNGEKSVKP